MQINDVMTVIWMNYKDGQVGEHERKAMRAAIEQFAAEQVAKALKERREAVESAVNDLFELAEDCSDEQIEAIRARAQEE